MKTNAKDFNNNVESSNSKASNPLNTLSKTMSKKTAIKSKNVYARKTTKWDKLSKVLKVTMINELKSKNKNTKARLKVYNNS